MWVLAFVAAYPSVLKGRRHALVVNPGNRRQAWLESTLYKVETGAIVGVFASLFDAEDWLQQREQLNADAAVGRISGNRVRTTCRAASSGVASRFLSSLCRTGAPSANASWSAKC
jgi:hypothetical protein